MALRGGRGHPLPTAGEACRPPHGMAPSRVRLLGVPNLHGSEAALECVLVGIAVVRERAGCYGHHPPAGVATSFVSMNRARVALRALSQSASKRALASWAAASCACRTCTNAWSHVASP